MAFCAGMHPTLYAKICLILSLYGLLQYVPKISVTKSANGEISITLTYRSAATPDGRSASIRTPKHGQPRRHQNPEKCQPSFQFDKSSKKKYKPPSKRRRDANRLAAFKRKRNRPEPPSELTKYVTACPSTTQTCLSGCPRIHKLDVIETAIQEYVINPMKAMIFIATLSVGLILLLFNTELTSQNRIRH